MPTNWNFYSAGRLLFGRDSTNELGDATARLGVSRLLIVTDHNLVSAGVLDRVKAPLEAAGITIAVFDGGEPEPSFAAADKAIALAADFRPDGILGLGGGSNMDLAKVTATVATHGGSYADYFGYDSIPGSVMPLICLPTTSGTGSEVSHAAVLTDTENEIKLSSLSSYLRPDLAVVDPLLTVSCPAQATADSGIDALTHAIEAYTAIDGKDLDLPPGEASPYPGRNPLADSLAEKAIALIGEHLETAVHQPENLAAREGMSLAATLAGLAFSNAAVALVHALEYPLGGALHCSHGAGNGLLLPYVMRYNLSMRTAEMARIARLLGEETTGLSDEEAALEAIVAVEKLRAVIGIPQRIRELGGTRDQLLGFAAKSFAIKRLMRLNPRRPSEADLLEILESAW